MTVAIPAECTEKFLKSANTPHLKKGCDPRLLVAAGALSFLCALWLLSLWGIVLSVFLFLFSCAVARRMAQEDPYMLMVIGQALRYARFYPARCEQALLVRIKC